MSSRNDDDQMEYENQPQPQARPMQPLEVNAGNTQKIVLADEQLTNAINVTGRGTVEIDLGGLGQGDLAPVEIRTQQGGWLRSGSTAIVTNFEGQPPLVIGQNSNVKIQTNAAEFMGFTPTQGADGKTVIQSNITLERANDGSIIVKQNGQETIRVPRDAKVDIVDDKGNSIITIDGNKDIDQQREALRKAEKKAFEEFKKDSPDRNMRQADFRSGSDPALTPPAASAPAASGPGMIGSLGTAGDAVVQAGRQAMVAQMGPGGQVANTVMNNLPRITGNGQGRA